MNPREIFRPYFYVLLPHEGVLSMVRTDPGNWTGGRVGAGELKGSKFGISAKSYPKLNIAGLTQEDAFEIYFEDFWVRCACDEAPPLLRYLLFDAAVNNGPGNSARFLQRALGVADDGDVGKITRAALANSNDEISLAERFARERVTMMSKLTTWPDFSRGWAIRLATIPFQAMILARDDKG